MLKIGHVVVSLFSISGGLVPSSFVVKLKVGHVVVSLRNVEGWSCSNLAV